MRASTYSGLEGLARARVPTSAVRLPSRASSRWGLERSRPLAELLAHGVVGRLAYSDLLTSELVHLAALPAGCESQTDGTEQVAP